MKILFVHNSFASFVKTDYEILSSAHDVRELYFKRGKDLPSSIRQTAAGVKWCDAVFSWFGGFHSVIPFFLANLLGRPRFVVASGYDVANVPEIQYGNMRPGFKRYLSKTAFQLASSILAVSDFTAKELNRNVPSCTSKVKVIHHGFEETEDPKFQQKVRRVVSIGDASESHLRRKSLETYVHASKHIPDADFALVGRLSDERTLSKLKEFSSPDLRFTGFIPDAFHSELLRNAKVFAQLSRYESFGCGVAEAMMQGCVPVVTNEGALPEVVGDTGFYVPYRDLEATVDAIRQALDTDIEYGKQARKRIIDVFPLEKRRRRLLQAVERC